MGEGAAETRERFRHFLEIPTRWADNDMYGHINNATYYSYFDTVVNRFTMDRGLLDPHRGGGIAFAAETGCRFHRALGFPDLIEAGLRVARLGKSSVTYTIGLFKKGDPGPAAATGHFVHVYVDPDSRRPVPIPADVRAALESLMAD